MSGELIHFDYYFGLIKFLFNSYKLMCQCWMIEKEERLTFSQVTEKLEEQAKGNVGSRRGKSMRQVVKDQELSRCELGELGSSDAYIIP